jgi:hypothetical protein
VASETTHWNLIAGNRQLLFRIAIPVPVPRSTGRIEHLKTSCQLSAVSLKRNLVIPTLSEREGRRNLTADSA